MELSEGFLNLEKKTAKTHNKKSSAILPKEVSDKVKYMIYEKKDDQFEDEKADKKKISLSNFKDLCENSNFIIEKWGQELYSIFKGICLFGDPFNNMVMKNTKWTKFLREANLIKDEKRDGKFSLEHSLDSGYGLKINDIDVIFFKISLLGDPNSKLNQSTLTTTSNLNNTKKVVNVLNLNDGKSIEWLKNDKRGSIINSGSKIDYNTFINSIDIISNLIFPNKPIQKAIEHIMVNNILPLEKKFNAKQGESQIDYLRDKQNNPELVYYNIKHNLYNNIYLI